MTQQPRFGVFTQGIEGRVLRYLYTQDHANPARFHSWEAPRIVRFITLERGSSGLGEGENGGRLRCKGDGWGR